MLKPQVTAMIFYAHHSAIKIRGKIYEKNVEVFYLFPAWPQ
jgi:hypothetical protein